MTAIATVHLSLRERAEQAAVEQTDKACRDNEQRIEQEYEREKARLVSEFNSHRLGVTIEADAVKRDAIAPFARVTVDGLTFATVRYYDDWMLAVRRECVRGCNEALWARLHYGLPALHSALTEEHSHDHDCLVVYDEEGEAITDKQGRPLPANPFPPATLPTMAERLADVVREIVRDELGHQGDAL